MGFHPFFICRPLKILNEGVDPFRNLSHSLWTARGPWTIGWKPLVYSISLVVTYFWGGWNNSCWISPLLSSKQCVLDTTTLQLSLYPVNSTEVEQWRLIQCSVVPGGQWNTFRDRPIVSSTPLQRAVMGQRPSKLFQQALTPSTEITANSGAHGWQNNASATILLLHRQCWMLNWAKVPNPFGL